MDIQEISDRLEINNLLIDYCSAVDAKTFADFDRIFTAEAVIDYTALGGIRGSVAEIKEYLGRVMPHFGATQHLIAERDQTVVVAGVGVTSSPCPATATCADSPHACATLAPSARTHDASMQAARRRRERRLNVMSGTGKTTEMIFWPSGQAIDPRQCPETPGGTGSRCHPDRIGGPGRGTTVIALTPSGDEAICAALHRLRRAGLNPVLMVTEPYARFGIVRERGRQLGIAAYQVASELELKRWQDLRVH